MVSPRKERNLDLNESYCDTKDWNFGTVMALAPPRKKVTGQMLAQREGNGWGRQWKIPVLLNAYQKPVLRQ